jgi:hypothetical protein
MELILPSHASQWAMLCIAIVEGIVGVLLLCGVALVTMAYLGAALLATFAGATLALGDVGAAANCGCYGDPDLDLVPTLDPGSRALICLLLASGLATVAARDSRDSRMFTGVMR